MTGGPGSGKTSIITELARRGFHTILESGRTFIREKMQSGGMALPLRRPRGLLRTMLERDLRPYVSLQALASPVIFRLGIPDTLGYLTLCGRLVPPKCASVRCAGPRL